MIEITRVIFTFDTYGTLIDWLGGLKKSLKNIMGLSDNKIIEFIKIWGEYDYKFVQGPYRPYREILYISFKKTLEEMRLKYDTHIINKLVYSIKEWPPFPDTRENLLKLKNYGEIGIISNTDREFIEASIKNMDVEFDHVVVAEDIKLYKPNPEVFNKARELIGINVDDKWIHISSYHTYDIIPAKESNEKIVTILLDRYGYADIAGKYSDYTFKDFRELADKIKYVINE